MAAATPRVSQGMLERAMGGMQRLQQLADENRSGNPSDATVQAFINDVLIEGNGDVNGYISPAVDLNDPSLQTVPMLIRYELAIDVYLAWFKGTGGLAVPPKVEAEYNRIVGELEKIKERKKGVGLPTRPSSGQVIEEATKSQGTDDWFNINSPRRWFDGWS